MTPAKSKSWFTRFAKATAYATGRPATFALALTVVVLWAVSGPLFHWSDTWQLVINTSTTIVTFLMVFLIQSTQNRDAESVQIKLDELLRVTAGAHNVLMIGPVPTGKCDAHFHVFAIADDSRLERLEDPTASLEG